LKARLALLVVPLGSRRRSSFVTTYDDGTNPFNRQQQLIATLAVP